jgi:hypothetical protein
MIAQGIHANRQTPFKLLLPQIGDGLLFSPAAVVIEIIGGGGEKS